MVGDAAVRRRRPWRAALAVGGAIVLAAGAATRSARAAPLAAALAASTTAASMLVDSFTLGAYTADYGRSNTSLYPFLYGRDDAVLVEPYRETTLRVEGGRSDVEYVWFGAAVGTGVEMDVVFNGTGIRRISVTGGAADPLNFTIYVKYVRREIRRLSKEDRRRWVAAASVLWKTSTRDGVAKYGPRYKDVHHVAIIHNDLAGNQVCDFIHGASGYAFVNAHAALGGMVEQAFQAVDPRTSMPYWDYTLDKWLYTDRAPDGSHKARGSRDLLALWDSPVWTSAFFGAPDATTGVVKDGAWAYAQVPAVTVGLANRSGFSGHFLTQGFASCYGQSDDVCTHPSTELLRSAGASTSHQANAFGLLRSPWNQRKEPTVIRARKMCGGANNAQFPDCVAWAQQQSLYSSFTDYMINLQVSPHGTVHVWSGGAFGDCSSRYDSLTNIIPDHSYLDQIKQKSSDLQKNLWMSGSKSCPSANECAGMSQRECGCRCHDLAVLEAGVANRTVDATTVARSDLWGEVLETAFDGFEEASRATAKLDALGLQEKLRILHAVCDVDVLTGDMLGSNSPMDVAFFATHAEVERMWQRYALSGNMTNDTWPVGPAAGSCPGQHAAYVLVWFDYKLDDAALDSKALTNVMWRDLLNPANPDFATAIPYVYENFDWTHCLHYSVRDVDASLMRPDDWVWNKNVKFTAKNRQGGTESPHANSDLGANATTTNEATISARAPAGAAVAPLAQS